MASVPTIVAVAGTLEWLLVVGEFEAFAADVRKLRADVHASLAEDLDGEFERVDDEPERVGGEGPSFGRSDRPSGGQ